MAYAMFPAAEAAFQPERPDITSYLFNHGGLSNQKMALAGLLLAGVTSHGRINLPYIHIRNQRDQVEWLARFEDVFELGPVQNYARRYGFPVECTLPSGERGGWPYFRTFSEYVTHAHEPDTVRALLNALAALRPRLAATAFFSRLVDRVFSLGVHAVIQMRIEADWMGHAQSLLPRVEGKDDIAIGYEEILRRTANTFPDLRRAYVTCDEPSLPVSKEVIRQFAQQRFGIGLLWKSDLIEPAQFNPLDLSIIDFEVARRAPRFIGMSLSTFANLLCMEAFTAQRRHVTGHFVYNHPGDTVRERHDNGLCLASAEAVLPNWTDRLWEEEVLAQRT